MEASQEEKELHMFTSPVYQGEGRYMMLISSVNITFSKDIIFSQYYLNM